MTTTTMTPARIINSMRAAARERVFLWGALNKWNFREQCDCDLCARQCAGSDMRKRCSQRAFCACEFVRKKCPSLAAQIRHSLHEIHTHSHTLALALARMHTPLLLNTSPTIGGTHARFVIFIQATGTLARRRWRRRTNGDVDEDDTKLTHFVVPTGPSVQLRVIRQIRNVLTYLYCAHWARLFACCRLSCGRATQIDITFWTITVLPL